MVEVKVLVVQLCPTLCHPMDCSLPGSSIPGILQARILEWVAIPFSRGIFLTRELKSGLPHCRQILYYVIYQGSCRSWAQKPVSAGPGCEDSWVADSEGWDWKRGWVVVGGLEPGATLGLLHQRLMKKETDPWDCHAHCGPFLFVAE